MRPPPEGGRGAVAAALRWNRRVTTPAMLAVWGLGFVLAMDGSWFAEGWLRVKLGAVLALSGLHGVQSGTLRRMAGGEAGLSWIAAAAPLVALMAGAIAVLAVVKPF